MQPWSKEARIKRLRSHQAEVCREEYDAQTFWSFNERPVEYAFVFNALARLYPRDVLDVGTGTTALPALMRTCGFLVTAIDNVRDYWTDGMANRHYHVVDDDITDTHLSSTFDLVTCVSVLEHIQDADRAIEGMFSLLKPGGHLVLTTPYTEGGYVRNVYDLPGSSYGQDFAFITQSFSRGDLDRWSETNSAVVLEQEYWRFWEGEYWTVGDRITPPIRVTAEEKHQISCVLLQKP